MSELKTETILFNGVKRDVWIQKGNVKGHYRTTKTGKRVFVMQHTDSRTRKDIERQARARAERKTDHTGEAKYESLKSKFSKVKESNVWDLYRKNQRIGEHIKNVENGVLVAEKFGTDSEKAKAKRIYVATSNNNGQVPSTLSDDALSLHGKLVDKAREAYKNSFGQKTKRFFDKLAGTN